MYKALRIITAALFLLPLVPFGCGGSDGGCKVDFDCPGAQICVQTPSSQGGEPIGKCEPQVCTSNAGCIDPALVCQANQCVPGDPPVDVDAGTPPDDQGVGDDLGTLTDTPTPPVDEGSPEDDTSVAVDTPATEDTAPEEDVSQAEDVPQAQDLPLDDTSDPEDLPVPEDVPEGPEDEGPGDEGPEGDEGFDQCGGITLAGCCAQNSAKVCTTNGLIALDCDASGGSCGWGPSGFYACGTEGLADPDGIHPFTCPGETCEGSCEGKNCGTDGCGNSCGDCEGGLTCNSETGVCEEDDPIDDVPTYFQDVQPIFMQYCNGCHTGGNSGGHNIASTYVDSFKSAGSCPGLMVGPCSLERMQNGTMPPGGADIPEFELEIVEDWVNAGMPQGESP